MNLSDYLLSYGNNVNLVTVNGNITLNFSSFTNQELVPNSSNYTVNLPSMGSNTEFISLFNRSEYNISVNFGSNEGVYNLGSNTVIFGFWTGAKWLLSSSDLLIPMHDIDPNDLSFYKHVVTTNSTSRGGVKVACLNSSKFFLMYNDSGSKAVIGTVSGTNISFGTAVSCPISSNAYSSVTKLTETMIVAAARNVVVVGTISGNSISFGSTATVTLNTNSNCSFNDIARLTDSSFILAYSENNSNGSYNFKLVVGTITGTNISFGTSVSYGYTNNNDGKVGVDNNSDNSFVAVCVYNNTCNVKIVVGSVSGSTITLGNSITTQNTAGQALYPSVACLSATRCIILYTYNDGSTMLGYLNLGIISGNSINMGTGSSCICTQAYNGVISRLSDDSFIIAYDNSSYYDHGYCCAGKLTPSDSISLGPSTDFNSRAYDPGISGLTSSSAIISYADKLSSPYAANCTLVLG